jgi:hypothetical protein
VAAEEEAWELPELLVVGAWEVPPLPAEGVAAEVASALIEPAEEAVRGRPSVVVEDTTVALLHWLLQQ